MHGPLTSMKRVPVRVVLGLWSEAVDSDNGHTVYIIIKVSSGGYITPISHQLWHHVV